MRTVLAQQKKSKLQELFSIAQHLRTAEIRVLYEKEGLYDEHLILSDVRYVVETCQNWSDENLIEMKEFLGRDLSYIRDSLRKRMPEKEHSRPTMRDLEDLLKRIYQTGYNSLPS